MIPEIGQLHQALQYGRSAGASASGLFSVMRGGVTGASIEKNPLLGGFLGYLQKESGELRKKPIPPLPFSLYALFDTSGDRGRFEEPYFERRNRLLVYGLSSWLWGKKEDVADLEDSIWAICDEYSWCLPAHMGGKSLAPPRETAAASGIIAEPWFDNAVKIDLFACETGLALAECCAALEGLIAPAVLERARKEVYRRLIKSYLDYGAFQHWELLKMNWCSVCAGGVGGAACYLIDDDLLLGGILHKLLPTVDRFLESFAGDGACVEGLSYWTYGVSYFVMFADLLFHRSGGRINLLDDPRFAAVARFQQKCYVSGKAAVTFSDAENSGFRLGLTHLLNRRIPGVCMPPIEQAMRMETEDRGHFNHALRDFPQALRDLLWTENREPVPFKPEPLVILPEAQWLIANAGETAFAAKGGHNDEPHNHNDVGTFIYYKKGKMVFADLGSGEYTRDYFNENRYTIFCNQSFSHSVPLINGEGQNPGREFRAKDCSIGPGAQMLLDMAGAYRVKGLSSLKRRFAFDPLRGTVTMEDRFTFSGGALPVTERFISVYPPEIKDGLVHIDTGDAVSLLTCSLQAEPVIHKREHQNHRGESLTVYLIDFSFSPEEPEFSAGFEIA
jgi:hypothetical protein